MLININKKTYKVNNDEYNKIYHQEYNNLKLYDNIALQERLIGLVKRIIDNDTNFFFNSINTTHGGFIPINIYDHSNNINLLNTNIEHIDNIRYNIEKLIKKSNINFIDNFSLKNLNIIYKNIYFTDSMDNQLNFVLNNTENWILIIKNKNIYFNGKNVDVYNLSNTEYYIYVENNLIKNFTERFKFYLGEKIDDYYILNYDNLINLCIMVKNGGPQFEQMLIDNLNIIDKWTILDTGSTDETIDIINRVLVNKKEGNLYQEPFINFRDSRNRLLDLADNECKFKLMLDDTYIIRGDLRGFLNEIRSDQYSDSFTLFIFSDDTKYGSNRITKSDSGLRYIHTIHEVITDKNNINVVIPENRARIEDRRFEYMEKRTMERKELDLKLLFQEVEENPNDPRAYYYLGQTYNLLEDYEKAFYFFIKRYSIYNAGFLQERYDAAFEAARIANFKLNKPWEECEKLYNNAFKIDETRPECPYFIGIHYWLKGDNKKAYEYFKQSFLIGFPNHCQYSLKPTLSFHFVPKFLARICYEQNDYILGQKAAEFFLLNNAQNSEDYEEISSWHKIYQKLNIYNGIKQPKVSSKPIICFVADGGFHPWSGSNILTSGVGGSETYIIEMARYIKQQGYFENVYVFCNTPEGREENFEGVIYRHLNNYYEFINTNYVHTSIISRFSEYLPVTYKGFCENVFLVLHDLSPSGIIIPKDPKLKNILCLTEWHVEYFTKFFPSLKDITKPFYYGIDNKLFPDIDSSKNIKQKYKFIYSSFPNRGLLELLEMWPEIYKIQPLATLHIYSNIYNEWSNNVEPEKMKKIQDLVNSYIKRKNENMLGIHYHGWVSKKELAEAWKTAHIWFYPCTFMETFCLTALEAAKSKTLVITNHLAALQNTVGDRGIIIDGDPKTKLWQDKALDIIRGVMSTNFNYDYLLNKNYNWALNLTWKNQANKLLNEYIFKNNLEYKGKYFWNYNIHNESYTKFIEIIDYFNVNYCSNRIGYDKKILEIGTHNGTSLINIIKKIDNTIGFGIDNWNENESLQIEKSFFSNVDKENLNKRIFGLNGIPSEILLNFINNNTLFDLIHIIPNNTVYDFYSILFLSWKLIESGGLIIIDRLSIYDENNELFIYTINYFLNINKNKFKTLDTKDYILIEKKFSL